MTDGPLKLDWLDPVKGVAAAVVTAIAGVLARMLIGRVFKDVDDKLRRLETSNADQTKRLEGLRGELADCRAGILVLQTEVENLKRFPPPAVTPR